MHGGYGYGYGYGNPVLMWEKRGGQVVVVVECGVQKCEMRIVECGPEE